MGILVFHDNILYASKREGCSKMTKQRGLRFWTRSIFNVSRWIGWPDIKKNASNIHVLYKVFFATKPVSLYRETFEEAVDRMGLSEEDIQHIASQYYNKSLFYLGILTAGLLYHIYLIWHKYWAAAIVMCSIDFMLFSFWFREHFWYTQIKIRRLGLSFKEWLQLCLQRTG